MSNHSSVFSNLCPSMTLYSHEEDYDNENKDVQKEAAKKKKGNRSLAFGIQSLI